MIGFAGSMVLALLADAATAAPPVASVPVSEKIVCRYYPVTGSIVQRTKVCHTRKEWSELNDNARSDMGRLTEKMAPGQSN